MLTIKNLKAKIEDKQILNGINLQVNPGEVHAIMGPNGSGKSTLASVLAGREDYEVNGGEVVFDGKNLLELDPDVRACEGIFLDHCDLACRGTCVVSAFQQCLGVAGVPARRYASPHLRLPTW